MATKTRVTLAAFRAAQTQRQYCQLRPQLATLKPAERRDYQVALADRSIPVVAIVRVLRGRGFKVTRHTIERHRQGICGNCYGVPSS